MHAVLTAIPAPCPRPRGFTLIEVLVVIVIVAILVMVGVPAMGEFVADQHVRTTTSDIAAEIAFARAKAIEASRRVYIEKTGVSWNNGWRIYVDLNDNGSYDAGEEIKTFDGFPPGRMRLCTTVAEFATNMIFRPDGRVVRSTAVGVSDGIYIVDTMSGTVQAKNKVRGLLFGLSGRVTVVKLNGTAPPC